MNYARAPMGESDGQHISPLSAYHAGEDLVLLLDTATYKFPPHWVPVTAPFAAMDTPDNETGLSRGWVEVR